MTTSSQKTVFSDIFILPNFFAKVLKLIDIIRFVSNKLQSIYMVLTYDAVSVSLLTLTKKRLYEYRCYVK